VEGLYCKGRLKAGLAFVYEQQHWRFGQYMAEPNSEYNATLLLSAYYTVLQRQYVSYYCGLAAGPRFTNIYYDDENRRQKSTGLGYQITAAGFNYHQYPVGIFIECGYGYKGVFCAGLQFNLFNPKPH
jgi:hypothetical protein